MLVYHSELALCFGEIMDFSLEANDPVHFLIERGRKCFRF